MKSYIKFIIITFIALLQLNCRKDSITFINGSRISGTLSYLGPNGPMPVPAGATLNVFLEGNTFASYTLKTTQLGNYSFTPQTCLLIFNVPFYY